MGRTFTTAYQYESEELHFLWRRAPYLWLVGFGHIKVTAKAKYATKYRTVPYYGNVTRRDCWLLLQLLDIPVPRHQ